MAPSPRRSIVTSRPVRAALAGADLALAAGAAAVAGGLLLARHLRRRRRAPVTTRRLMAIDSMYDLGTLRARHAEHIVTHRDLDGFFDRVWNVHPFAGIHAQSGTFTTLGAPLMTRLNDVHTMIEGRPGRFARLAFLPYLNFVLAQAQLVLELDRIVREEGVALVRGDAFYHGLLASLLAGLHGLPWEIRVVAHQDAIYATTGELAYGRLLRWRVVEQRLARFTLPRADSVVVQSRYTSGYALGNGARPERLTISPMAIFVDPVHLDEPAGRAPLEDDLGLGDRPVVCFVGRLEHVKHPEDVVAAVAEARARDPRIAAIFVGDGSMRAELTERCAQLGMQDDVVFAGVRDQRWIARLLARCAVIAAPLSGLALVESALSATPIVAYDVEWHAEFLADDREAVLVDYRDTAAMGAAICALVEDPARGRRLAQAARARALEVMNPSTLIVNERAIAERLIAGGPARRRSKVERPRPQRSARMKQ